LKIERESFDALERILNKKKYNNKIGIGKNVQNKKIK